VVRGDGPAAPTDVRDVVPGADELDAALGEQVAELRVRAVVDDEVGLR
jgi:hypothetical protein